MMIKMMRNYSEKAFIPQDFTENFASEKRKHQGIPGIEILPTGRLFTCWYAGFEAGEGPGNFVLLSTSSDGGQSWKEIQVIAPSDPKYERAYDPVLWLDPQGRLWWFWSQCNATALWNVFDGRAGVWATCCENPDTDRPEWNAPRRIADGVMMNKPSVLSDGTWLLPVSLWSCYPEQILPELEAVSKANVLLSKDNGKTFELIIGTRISDPKHRSFDEHMLVERLDASWWMLMRGTNPGIWESFSYDNGKSWYEPAPAVFDGPNSRFAIRRLNSGKLLMVNHRMPHRLPGEIMKTWLERNNLTAWLSEDDGKTWKGGLLIDERNQVSYPDITEGEDAFIYLVYDHARLEHGQIIMARFTEADIMAGALITTGAFQNTLVNAFAGRP